jgi:hypothetical protein
MARGRDERARVSRSRPAFVSFRSSVLLAVKLRIPVAMLIISRQPANVLDRKCKVARQTTVTFVDDLDGSAASDTVSFALEGRAYEIDLSEHNAAKLRDALAPFVAAARRAGSTTRGRPRVSGGPQATGDRERTAAIREWAAANGYTVSARGRIARTVMEAYDNRDTTPSPVSQDSGKTRSRKRAAKGAA